LGIAKASHSFARALSSLYYRLVPRQLLPALTNSTDLTLMDKKDILLNTSFGERIAEEETDTLSAYFVETDQWNQVISGKVDVVYGPKGSGKSALYSLLRSKTDELRARGILLAPGETVRGAPVFADLVPDPPASEEVFRGLWKLYFLSLIGTILRFAKVNSESATRLMEALESAELIQKNYSLKRSLRAAYDYVRRIDSVSGELKINPATGVPDGIGAKVTIREPASDRRKLGFISADELLDLADIVLHEIGFKFWIVLDRLDVAFTESSDLEGNALRALFHVYRDMASLKNVSLKIFLRDDIWARITNEGFREASHITRAITITWDTASLRNLIVKRACHNQAVREFYGVQTDQVMSSVAQQEALFNQIFPPQVDPGTKKLGTLEWILSRASDGTRKPAPREVIHLVSAARDQQLKIIEMGGDEPEGEHLFDRTAIKGALPEVSKFRYQQTLLAEHPNLKNALARLEGEKTQQTSVTLAKIWKVSNAVALETAERLVEIGFFERRGSKDRPVFWVPFLYRDALEMVQGPAE
jgi:hypothetical protein